MSPTPAPSSSTSLAPRVLALVLVAGAALLGLGAVMHPVLTGEAVHDLDLMAATPGWRVIHLTMLAGSVFVIGGIWVRVAAAPTVRGTLVAALAVISVGLALNALNIAYMAGSGTHLAEMYRAGRADAVPLFEVTHPIGLMSARFGNALVAIGAIALGWAERESGSPEWIAWLAWVAAVCGLVGVCFFDESSRMILAAVSVLSAWEVATAALVLRGRLTA